MRKIERPRGKLVAKREELLNQLKVTTLIMQKVSDVVDIPENVWWKAKMFDAELKKNGPRFRDVDAYVHHGSRK